MSGIERRNILKLAGAAAAGAVLLANTSSAAEPLKAPKPPYKLKTETPAVLQGKVTSFYADIDQNVYFHVTNASDVWAMHFIGSPANEALVKAVVLALQLARIVDAYNSGGELTALDMVG